MWYVYILLCGNGGLYTGITNDMKRRLRAHVSGSGAKYTRTFKVSSVVFMLPVVNRSRAASIECQIKQLNRIQKLQLIKRGGSNGGACDSMVLVRTANACLLTEPVSH